jgi:hypothetical protein
MTEKNSGCKASIIVKKGKRVNVERAREQLKSKSTYASPVRTKNPRFKKGSK